MRLIQFRLPEKGRRLGYIDGDRIVDLTSVHEKWRFIHTLFLEARRCGSTISAYLADVSTHNADIVPYNDLLETRPEDAIGWILPPLDHPDPSHCLISGTGLTHMGSMEKRAEMHIAGDEETEFEKTDSEKMFEMGLRGGKPDAGVRGVQPEWFYKGTGVFLRGHNDFLDIPDFTEDGGEEPEIVGCYVIDDDGVPCRIGFAIGNEWADHPMERVNYLWLAPSKMRACAVGPELITDKEFDDIQGSCRITRGEELLYHSGKLMTGERHMSHSLANLEDHHFKYSHFRRPGDVHIHFFGTMKLAFPNRPTFQTGDRIEICFDDMGAPLVNYPRQIPFSKTPVIVESG